MEMSSRALWWRLGENSKKEQLLTCFPWEDVARELWSLWRVAAPHLGFKITSWLKEEKK